MRKTNWYLVSLVCYAIGFFSQSVSASFYKDRWTLQLFDLGKPSQTVAWSIVSVGLLLGVWFGVIFFRWYGESLGFAATWLLGYVLMASAGTCANLVTVKTGQYPRPDDVVRISLNANCLLWQYGILALVIAAIAMFLASRGAAGQPENAASTAAPPADEPSPDTGEKKVIDIGGGAREDSSLRRA